MQADMSQAHNQAFRLAATTPPEQLMKLQRAIDQAVASRQSVVELRKELVRQGVFP